MALDLEKARDKIVKRSNFSFLYGGEHSYVYHAVSMDLHKLDNAQKQVYDQLQESKPIGNFLDNPSTKQGLETLINRGIVVSDGVDEQEVYRNLNKKALEVNFGLLYLLTTDACNLACQYCFVETLYLKIINSP